MTHDPPEDRLAALQEESRRAGRESDGRWRRFIVRAIGVSASCGMLGVLCETVVPMSYPVALLLCAGVVLPCLAVPVFRFRLEHEGRRTQRRFRRRIERLTPEQKVELLVPLQERASGEARDMAILILRDRTLPAELSPAGSPEGTGAEVSAARR